MGCTVFRTKDYASIEDIYFKDFEDELGFSRKSSWRIDKYFYRYSNSNLMSQKVFNRTCEMLGVDLNLNGDFFMRFHTISGYLTQKLNSLGIMLGKGLDAHKIKLLFRNYDNDISNTLSKPELEKLITDCVTISCVILPTHILNINRSDLLLEEYVNLLENYKHKVIENLMNDILEGREKIFYTEFNSIILQKSLCYILSPRKIRTYALSLNSLAKPSKSTPDSTFLKTKINSI
jgi:hypothetical protein